MSRTCPECHNTYDDDVLHCPEDGRGLSDVPAADDLIGRMIGSYRVEKLLGKGGMGAVYMGVHPRIGSKVAIKFLHPQYSHDDRIVDRFYNEARAVNVIGHDNILKILDLNVTEDNRHYFVMEFLQGRAVQGLLKHNVGMPLEVAGPILLQCCDALEAAHRKGIVHRDLKPDNVYLISMKGRKNFVKVVDFGIARVTDDSGESTNKTQAGMVMGTPAYMSPEQGSGQTSRIDGRSDVYSLGVMMYQMATGRLPFPGSNFGEVLMGHLQQPPPPPRSIKPEIPEAYEAIILKCLAKKQEDRYQSMEQLKQALEACMEKLHVSRELPAADATDLDLPPVDVRPSSNPGQRTPGRQTAPAGPVSKNRVSTPNARGPRSTPGTRPLVKPTPHPAQRTTQPQRSSKAGLWVTLAVVVLAGLGAGGWYFLRTLRAEEGRRLDLAAKEAASRAVKVAAAEVPARPTPPEEDTTPVFLSVISDPLEADVTATWKDGDKEAEKKGQAPLSFEVPRNTKVHFEFSKAGFIGYAMDVIADQAQSVRASLKPAPVAEESVPEKKQHHKKRSEARKAPAPVTKDGVIDIGDALK